MRKHRIETFTPCRIQMKQHNRTTESTILLVEDDDDTRRVYSIMLRHSGFRVVEAASGGEAVERAREEHVDLILMDLNLPTFDGWEAARLIKADPDCSMAPLVAFSALIESIADLRRGSDLFDGFIAKPVTPSELVRRVRAYLELLGRTPTRRPTVRSRAPAQSPPAALA
jgi:CheY-like chemotaxis protein